ncbi:MAG: DUF3291 domain-containing protein [Chloroflexi bacterium]|nr:DUF3291 domain-containing protein [Chloroflexota bacterium]
MDYQIAEINIGRILGSMDSPIMKEFKDNLDRINALAETSPGFVWRLKGDNNNATDIHVYDDPFMIINMSVWESIDSLFEYVYKSAHTPYVSRRKEWFEKLTIPIMVLWWIPAGHQPTPAEAKLKLEYLDQHGATPNAFTFKQRFTVEEWLSFNAPEKVE